MMATLPGSKVRTGAVRRHMTEFIQSDSIFVYLQGREVFSGTIQFQASISFSSFLISLREDVLDSLSFFCKILLCQISTEKLEKVQ